MAVLAVFGERERETTTTTTKKCSIFSVSFSYLKKNAKFCTKKATKKVHQKRPSSTPKLPSFVHK